MTNPEILHHPGTGETLRVLESTPDVFRIELAIAPHGQVAGAHVHPSSEQTFEVVAGTLACRVHGRDVTLRTGESTVLPPGTPHDQGNPFDEEVRAIETFRPAARMHDFFRVFFALAREGRTDAAGVPTPLWAAALFAELGDSIRPASLALRVMIALLAPVARLLGYQRAIQRMIVEERARATGARLAAEAPAGARASIA